MRILIAVALALGLASPSSAETADSTAVDRLPARPRLAAPS